MNDIYRIIGGGKIFPIIINKVVRAFYHPIFVFFYHDNFWNIYRSYHLSPKKWKKIIWNKYMELHAASISIDAQIDSPLILPHGVSGIFLTQFAKVGKNVVIFQQVTIGANTIEGSKSYGAPTIGSNVYIGAGAKIIGNVYIADNCRIGANAVVVEDVPYNSLVVTTNQELLSRNKPRTIYFIHTLGSKFHSRIT